MTVAELRAKRDQKLAQMRRIIDQAKAENRSLNRAEADEFDTAETEFRSVTAHLKSEETKAEYNAQSVGEAYYSGDDRTEGRENELLRPDQSLATWLERRRGKGQPHDVDWNTYWAQRMGLEKPGIEVRSLGEDTSSGAGAGQAIVPQQWSTSFVDLIRPRLVVSRAGATVMPMETEQYNLPQFMADVSPQWLAEGTQLTLDANPQFAPVTFQAIGAFTDLTLFSRQLAEDTNQSGGLSGLLQDTIGQKYARLIDQVAFYGVTGNAGNPGLDNETGLQVQTLTGDSGSGAAPTDTTSLSKMAEAVRKNNGEVSAFVSNPQVLGTFMRLNASTYAKYWDFSADVANIPWYYSSTLVATETDTPAETGGTLSSLYAGDWSRMIIGMRVDLNIQVLKERYADFNQIGLLSYMRFSIRTTHPEVFVRTKGIMTT